MTNETSSLQAKIDQITALLHTDRETALQLCNEGLAQARPLRDEAAFIVIARYYGLIMDHLGQPGNSVNVLFEALQITQAKHLFADEAQLLQLIARSYYTVGDYHTALQYWARCSEIAEAVSDILTSVQAKIGLGQIYDSFGSYSSAFTLHTTAAKQLDAVYDPYLFAKVHINLAANLIKSADLDNAVIELQKALAVCENHGFHDYAAEARFRMSEILLQQKNYSAALLQLDAAEHDAKLANYVWGQANIQGCRAEALAGTEDFLAALAANKLGQTLAQSINATHILARFHLAASRYAEQLGDAPRALAELKIGYALEQQSMKMTEPDRLIELENETGLRPSPSRMLVELSGQTAFVDGDLDAAYATLVQAASKILDIRRAGIWALADADTLVNQAIYDQFEPAASVLPQFDRAVYPAFFQWLDRYTTLIAHDAQEHQSTWELTQDYLRPLGVASLMANPIRLDTRGKKTWLICEHIGPQRNWTPNDALYANQLADIGARAAVSHERQRFQSAINELNQSLISANEQLESRVQERTIELQQAMTLLVQTEKLASLGSLVAGIAHELNTPLGVTLMAAGTFRADVNELQKHMENNTLRKSTLEEFISHTRDAAGLIERNALRASELIGNFKQVAVDTSSDQRRRFNLLRTIEEVLSTLTPQLKRTPHLVSIDVPDNILMESYPGPLEQVLSNLINNSLLHGLDEEKAGHIAITAQVLSVGLIRLVYSDDGRGIPESHIKRVFDPFFTTRLGQGGSGLGLYIVFNLITGVLGGQLKLDSEPGKGVRFRMDLPLNPPEPKREDNPNAVIFHDQQG